jgi:hypothetical protein
MPRKRLVSPEFYTHSALYETEASTGLPLRLAFSGLWTQADRRGIFKWRPRELKLAILPYDPVDFGAVLDALASGGFVESYTANGERLGIIPKFARWQTFHHAERPSDVPAPGEPGASPVLALDQPGGSRVLAPDQPGSNPTVAVTVTVAVADAVRSVAERLPTNCREALHQLTTASRNPTAWAAEIMAMLDGMHGPPTPPDVMATALRDMLVAGAEPTARALRGFVRKSPGVGPPVPLHLNPEEVQRFAETGRW